MKKETNNFRQYLINNHLAANTIKSYMKAVEQYCSMYENCDAKSLDSYKQYLVKHHRPQTINLRILSINKFLTYIGKGNLALPLIKMQHLTFTDNIVSTKEYEFIKRKLLEDGDYKWFFMIWAMGASGARVSELLQIRIEDILHGSVELLSKGGKTRYIYFPRALRKAIAKWGVENGQTSGFLFTNNRGYPITSRGFSLHLKTIAAKYGLDPATIHPHSFRHMYAKTFLNKRADIATLADILGHESIKTTQIYLRRSCSEQKRIIDKIVTW